MKEGESKEEMKREGVWVRGKGGERGEGKWGWEEEGEEGGVISTPVYEWHINNALCLGEIEEDLWLLIFGLSRLSRVSSCFLFIRCLCLLYLS